MSPVSLDQLGYLEVMIPAFTQATLGPGWTGLTGLLGGVCECVFQGEGEEERGFNTSLTTTLTKQTACKITETV